MYPPCVNECKKNCKDIFNGKQDKHFFFLQQLAKSVAVTVKWILCIWYGIV